MSETCGRERPAQAVERSARCGLHDVRSRRLVQMWDGRSRGTLTCALAGDDLRTIREKGPRGLRLVFALPMLLGVLSAFAGCGEKAGGSGESVLIAAATSVRHVLPRLIAAFQQASPGEGIEATYAASGTLRQQVEAGAPIDALVLVGGGDIDALTVGRRVIAGSRRVVASNTLVLIGGMEGPPLDFASLGQGPDTRPIAIGDPASVPAGRYAKEALTALGRWDGLAGRLVLAQDVAGVLAHVRRGEVAAGIVYATEVRGVEGVRVLDRVQGGWAPRPEVVVALVVGSAQQARGQAFLAFLASPSARAIWEEAGFGPP